jgi:hypothetical protein
VDRWKQAWAELWRTEPAPALVLYFLLAAATAGYVHIAGVHFASGLGSPHTLIDRDGSTAGLVTYAFLTWCIWLGGSRSWSLSLLWQLLVLVVTVNACYRTPEPAACWPSRSRASSRSSPGPYSTESPSPSTTQRYGR